MYLGPATRLVEAGQAVDLNCGNPHGRHSPAMLSEIQGAFLKPAPWPVARTHDLPP